jgi:hypothetical protein
VRPRLEALEDRVTPSGLDTLSFSTGATVGPNQATGAIMVQLQDSNNHAITATSNVTVKLSSSSSTGEFLNLSGNPLANNSLVIPAGFSSAFFEYEDSQTGQMTIKGLSTSPFAFGGTYVDVQNRLVFTTSPQTLTPGQVSQPITVQLQDANGNAVKATSDVTVSLYSSSSTGKLLDTSGNPLANNSVVIAAGSSSASFEFEDSQAESAFLDADTGGVSASQTENVAYSLAFTTSAQVIASSHQSGPITIQLQDANGNAIKVASAYTLNLSSSSFSGKFFDTSGNALPASPSGFGYTLTVAAGSSSASFQYEDSTTGAPTITVQGQSSTGVILGASAQQQIYVGQPLAIITPAQSITPGKPSQLMTVQLQNTATSAETVELSSTSSTGTFLDASGKPLPANSSGGYSLTIAAGTSSASFEYEDSTTGLPTISAETSGLTFTDTQQENVGLSLNFTTKPQTVAQGQKSETITVQLQDSSGNPFTAPSNITVDLTGPLGSEFYNSSGSFISGSLTIAAGSNSASFEYEDTFGSGVQAQTVTASLLGISSGSASQQETVTPPPFNSIAFASPTQTLAANQPSQPITVQLQNNGAAYVAPSNMTITLSSSSSGGKFLDTSGNALTNNTITIVAGSSSASFEYEDSQEGYPTLIATVTSASLSGSQSENVGGVTLGFATSAQPITAGQPSGTITVQFQDSNGKAVTNQNSYSDYIYLSSNSKTGQFLDTTGKPLTSNEITIAPGASSASFEYEDSIGGAPTLTASSYSGASVSVTQQQTVNGPYSLEFSSGAQPITPNQASQPITVQLVNSTGTAATAASAVTVSLSSSSSSGQFLDTTGKALPNNSITIAAGSGSASFEYEDSQAGLPTITASENGFSSTQLEAVGVKLAFTTTAQPVTAGQDSPTLTVQLQDSNGNAITAPNDIALNLSGAFSGSTISEYFLSEGVRFLDTTGKVLPTTSGLPTLTIAKGSSSASFEFNSPWGGSLTVSAEYGFGIVESGEVAALLSATQQQTVQGLSALVFTTSPQTLAAGQTSGTVTVQLQDNNGNAANAPSGGLTINLFGGGLLSSSSTKFFDANGNLLPTGQSGEASITMPAGASTVSFKFESNQAGPFTISASASSASETGFVAEQTETVQTASPNSVAFVSPAQSLTAGTPSGSITVRLEDQYGNVISAGSGGLTFNLSSSSSTGKFLSVSGDPLASSSITIPQGASSATFEYEDSTSGTPTLTVTASGVSNTQQEAVASTSTEIPVSNTNDSGAGSLRAAIDTANANLGGTIVFDSGVTGTIDLQSALPNVLFNTNIIGPGANVLTIQPSASATGPVGGLTVGFTSSAFAPPEPTVTISGLTVANFSGTGITNNGNLTLRQVDVSNTQALSTSVNSTSGIAEQSGIINDGTLTVLDSTVADNAYSGIYSVGPLIVVNSTVAGNTGGGITVIGFGTLIGTGDVGTAFSGGAYIASSTISGNTDTTVPEYIFANLNDFAGGITNFAGAVTLYDTIVAGNAGAVGPTGSPLGPNDVDGAFNSLGYNLIGQANSSSSGFVSTDQVGTTTNPIDPKLGALANNGGPTLTMALLTGSPAIAAGSSANAPATDQRGDVRPQQSAIDIGAVEVRAPSAHPISLLPKTLPAATVGTSYSQSITASGGVGTLTLSTNPTTVSLPGGLTLSISGSTLTISGKPTASGSASFSLTATDNSGDRATQSFTMTVNSPSTTITLSPSAGPLPSATVGASYNQSITASGGIGTLSVTDNVPSNTLGLSFSLSGSTLTISGKPTASGSVTFTVTGSDTNGDTTGPQSYTLTVNAAGAITLSPGSGALPSGTVGVAYNQTITASGGAGTLTLSTNPTSVSLPAGLNLSISGSTLTISGKPTDSGSGSFSVTATDASNHTEMQNYTLAVNAAPPPPPPAPPAPPAPPVLHTPPLLGFFNSLFGGGTVTVNADGTETVTDSFFGFPLFVSTFDASGKLTDVTLFGIDITFLFLLL